MGERLERIGFIGLGAMGLPMARNLARAGFRVAGCDVRAEAVAALVEVGGRPAATPAEAARDAELVMIVVVSAQQVESVLYGPNGALETLPKGAIVMPNATVPASFARATAARLLEAGYGYIDAPISGGAARSASGELTVMASGAAADLERAMPALDVVSAKVYRLGEEPGIGSTVKTINQLLAGVHIAAAAEAMALGAACGADTRALFEVVSNSAGNSWMFSNRVPHMLDGDFTPLSAVDIFVKDLGIVLDTGREKKFPLPVAAAAHQMFLMAAGRGWGRLDDSAVVKVYEECGGTPVERKG